MNTLRVDGRWWTLGPDNRFYDAPDLEATSALLAPNAPDGTRFAWSKSRQIEPAEPLTDDQLVTVREALGLC